MRITFFTASILCACSYLHVYIFAANKVVKNYELYWLHTQLSLP